ncbi:gamma-glutamylcyclotransferase family protein [Halorubrum vacuolatum]|uniref:Gamma-glutamyl cyclotransferase, AIG2-like n=1 Tax=Halorubrum vacuolatum TaxID=63740 RepID=A0A238WBK4_HALVU|nr:gamma-glutamylcyclotransferase family protein [Halorubrum vacuolatum]SNR43797.1 Gamma-glutamyl cyclotransferase, AIG2-like [Halorubrum vacuolatum]
MDVFVYGTLTAPERVRELLDSFAFVGPATLSGMHLVEGAHPTLAPGGRTAGRLLRTEELTRLDRYEGIADGLYVRVAVPLAVADACDIDNYPDEAVVYVGDPDRLDAAATWPGNGGFPKRVDQYLTSADVRVSVDPATPV